MSNDHADQVIAELVGNGFFDLEVTDTGILVYSLSDDAETIAPEIYRVMKDAMTDELLDFVERGLVEVRFNDTADMEWRFTPAGLDFLREKGYNVPEQD